MWLSAIDPGALTRQQLTRLLYGTGLPDPVSDARRRRPDEHGGDCIFVFGGPHPERVTTAVRLYREGCAPAVLFSGGTKWGQRTEPEAMTMRRHALTMGVPAEAILVEIESNHTKENVLASLLVLDRAIGLHRLRRLLVVSAPYHMRCAVAC